MIAEIAFAYAHGRASALPFDMAALVPQDAGDEQKPRNPRVGARIWTGWAELLVWAE